GNYSITLLNADDVLIFQYVGYIAEEQQVNGRSVIDVSLAFDITELKEIVVVGYGVQEKADLTGAISVVSSEDLQRSNATTVDQALQGKAAGVMITRNNGSPGSKVKIRVRGIGSINNKAEPLVIVDGVAGEAEALNTLNPEEIESIQVLKDATSAAIYGARASNGVILIQTKRGAAGKTKVHFSAIGGLSVLPKKLDLLNREEYLRFYEEAYKNSNELAMTPDSAMPSAYQYAKGISPGHPDYADTDWQDAIANNAAYNQNYYLSLSGGGENSTFAISGNFIKDKGILRNSSNNIYSLKASSDFKGRKNFQVRGKH
ncbi:MAG: TonB-dependent receptor plug domain-containing protein, partial [Bacteroidales bacterium]|nr:TonB-dependent receptor plug domain-containing protein [Bacteroidales bacterium]